MRRLPDGLPGRVQGREAGDVTMDYRLIAPNGRIIGRYVSLKNAMRACAKRGGCWDAGYHVDEMVRREVYPKREAGQ